MSIRHLLGKIKNIALPAKALASAGEEVSFDNRQRGNERLDSQSPSEPVATFTFDKDGQIENRLDWKPYFLSLVIILTALLSFGLGRLSVVGEKQGITVEYDQSLTGAQAPLSGRGETASAVNALSSSSVSPTEVIGSKNGAKYHYPHCPGAKQIAEKNKLVFASPAAAEASGYTLASNCKPK